MIIDAAIGRVPTSGGELVVRDEGHGEAVLLLHGTPLSSYVWRAFAPVLASRFRVIAPDLLGHGASDRPTVARLDLRAQAGYVGEVLDRLNVGRCAVVGHGTGGGVAQLLALEGRADALVLLDSVTFDGWPRPAELELLRGAGAPTEAVGDWMLAAVADASAVPREAIEAYAKPFRGDQGRDRLRRLVDALDGRGLTGHEDAMAAWDLPVLLLWGEDDPFAPAASAERLNESIPTSTLGLLPGCGHLLPEEAPDTIVPMVHEYLRARYLGAPHGHEGVTMLQLERRPPWVDLAEYEQGDDEPATPDPADQEVGPGA